MAIFLTAGLMAAPDNYNKEIKTLISQRIDILNDYYRCKTNYNQTEENLEKIVSGRLLKNDIANMREFAAVDVEQVTRYKIKIKSSSKTSYGIIKGKVEIQWGMETYNGTKKLTSQYYFTGESKGGRTKLTQMKNL